jgi:hypothetical protein
MHPALKKFIEEGERELEGLEEPERTIRAQQLQSEVLRRFQPEMFTGAEAIDGNFIDEPITDKDVEDKIIQEHFYHEDNKSASDMAEEGCYGDDGEGSEPRLRGMMKAPTTRDWGQTFRGAPDPRTSFLKGVVDAPVGFVTAEAIPDAVDLGGVYEDRVAERMGGVSQRNDLFTRSARSKFRGGTGRAPTTCNYRKTCEFCEVVFLGTKNAKYCGPCRAPQMAAVRKRLREEQVTSSE